MAKKIAKPVKPVKPVKAAKPARKPVKKPAAAKVTKAAKKYVYSFANGKAEGDRTMKDTLGGKGSGLAEMTNAGLPVPPGFTISTAACKPLVRRGPEAAPGHRGRDGGPRAEARAGGRVAVRVDDQPAARLRAVGREVLDARHDGHDPDLGLNDEAVEGLKARTSNGRFAYDSYRRFIQMFATSCSRSRRRSSSTSSRR